MLVSSRIEITVSWTDPSHWDVWHWLIFTIVAGLILTVVQWMIRKAATQAALLTVLFHLRPVVFSFLIAQRCTESKATTSLLVWAMLLVAGLVSTFGGLTVFGVALFFYVSTNGVTFTWPLFILAMLTLWQLVALWHNLLSLMGLWIYLDMHKLFSGVRELMKDRRVTFGAYEHLVKPHLEKTRRNEPASNSSPPSSPPSVPPAPPTS